MIEIVPATKELTESLYEKVPATFRGVAMVDDGEVVAVGGVYRSNDCNVLFMKATDVARKKQKTLFKSAKTFIAGCAGTIYAKCDASIDGADRFLEHLGFKHMRGDIWIR